jgi:hypothetical protein
VPSSSPAELNLGTSLTAASKTPNFLRSRQPDIPGHVAVAVGRNRHEGTPDPGPDPSRRPAHRAGPDGRWRRHRPGRGGAGRARARRGHAAERRGVRHGRAGSLERHRAPLQPRLRPARRAEPGPQRAGRHLPRRAAGAGVRAGRVVVRDHRLVARGGRTGPARHPRRVHPALRPCPPDAGLGDVARRHDHDRPRRAPRAPVRRRARDVRPGAGRDRELEQHARPGVRRPHAAGAGRRRPARAHPRPGDGVRRPRRAHRGPRRRAADAARPGAHRARRGAAQHPGLERARDAGARPRRRRRRTAQPVPDAVADHVRRPLLAAAGGDAGRRQHVVEHRRRLRADARALVGAGRGGAALRAGRRLPRDRSPHARRGAPDQRRPAGRRVHGAARLVHRPPAAADAHDPHHRRRAGAGAGAARVRGRRGGHCTFTDGEMLAALRAVERRVGAGRWSGTDPASLNAAAVRIDPAGPAPAYQAYRPAPYPRPFDLAGHGHGHGHERGSRAS